MTVRQDGRADRAATASLVGAAESAPRRG